MDLHVSSKAKVSIRGRPPKKWGPVGDKRGSRPVSRVLSRTTIPLGRTSPYASSDLPGSGRGPRRAPCGACFPIWSCSRWGLPCRDCCQPRGALLPHRFTLTTPALQQRSAVYFLLHFPWACAPQALPGTSPYGARTFLPDAEFPPCHGGCPAGSQRHSTLSSSPVPDAKLSASAYTACRRRPSPSATTAAAREGARCGSSRRNQRRASAGKSSPPAVR